MSSQRKTAILENEIRNMFHLIFSASLHLQFKLVNKLGNLNSIDNVSSISLEPIAPPPRYVEVFDASSDDMEKSLSDMQEALNNSEPIVYLRGLPYRSSEETVREFFEGLKIAEIQVLYPSSLRLFVLIQPSLF